MLSAMFSKKSTSEGRSGVELCPGPPSGGCCYEEENQGSELSCTHKQEHSNQVEKEACLLSPNSKLKTEMSSSSSTTMMGDGRPIASTNSCMSGFAGSCTISNSVNSMVNTSCSAVSSAEQCSSNSTKLAKFPSSSELCGEPLKVQLPPSPSSRSCSKSDFDEMDIRVVPAKALNVPTRTRLSLMLNPPKFGGNDWTGLASEMGFEYEMIENFALERDPMKLVLAQWTTQQDSTVGVLLDMLKDLERDDVLLDITKLVERDARRWLERRKGDAHGQPIQDPEVSGSYPHVPKTTELRGITLEDHPSGPPEIFDAYVCFTDIDSDFVKEMISVLENEPYNLKLCVDFRDLVPGGSYSTVTAELIENRCKRMIIVLSPDFIASEQCDFQTKFAHSIAPSARNKSLIPVMVEPCVLPTILRHITICDYTKKDLRRWFWQRLYSSLSRS
ncbi:myeloid differentiation primary response protein MyD88-like [Asterias rubens]|uniref:myeloid differentiation primary response protein MyD88-like n=1 Tax=Asterias rubens TaxID=7604 RepID=UPI001454E7AC|nr:myeloid differentiation primary response protein MyD88-like [Asterias rubens]